MRDYHVTKTSCAGPAPTSVPLCLSVGNSLVIAIVAATKAFHSVASVLIMNLAVSDLLVGVGVMPLVALSIMNRGWAECTVGRLNVT